jgi:serine/threonine-protein kinase HipA
MKSVKKINVQLLFDTEALEVGSLVLSERSIYFKYSQEFLDRGLDISPLKLGLNAQINKANDLPFDGLFGVFADSLPDGWGKLLIDRALTARGISLASLSTLDRLAYIGKNGMGALIYKPELTMEHEVDFDIELDDIAKGTKQIIAGTASDALDKIYQLGGSSVGARPKILVGFNPKTQHILGNEITLPIDYEHWIIKFPATNDLVDLANIEFAYYKMAVEAGIEMNECRLFESKSGNTYFGTKRFDREGNKRLHLHSAAGIMHDNFRYSSLDYGHLMDGAFQLERDVKVYEKVFRLAAFNVFANNRDDHSKNFSFLMNVKGEWRFAPAYDLTFSNAGNGMHSTMIAGESKVPTTLHLLKLANYFKVKNAEEILDQVNESIHHWRKTADLYGVSRESKNTITKIICP